MSWLAVPKITITTDGGASIYELRSGKGLQALHVNDGETGLEFDCRKADCGICIFQVIAGSENLSPCTFAERDFLKAMRANSDERLACQTRVFGDVHIAIEKF